MVIFFPHEFKILYHSHNGAKFITLWQISSQFVRIEKSFRRPLERDVYKTRTPSRWTPPVDLIHGPFCRPSPWTNPVNQLYFDDLFLSEVLTNFKTPLIDETVSV